MEISVRVYGLYITGNNELLVSDEYIRGGYYTKLPGGGLETGEGTRDCLKREFKEELNADIEVLDHVYTTDFYQPSAFSNTSQILSIYYTVKLLKPLSVNIRKEKFDFTEAELEMYNTTKSIEAFRMIPLSDLKVDDMTLPIDKVVIKQLLSSLENNKNHV